MMGKHETACAGHADLGQKEAESEKATAELEAASEEQLRHMEGRKGKPLDGKRRSISRRRAITASPLIGTDPRWSHARRSDGPTELIRCRGGSIKRPGRTF